MVCVRCGAGVDLGLRTCCASCGGIVELRIPWHARPPGPGVWRHSCVLPGMRQRVSLGEGDTSLLDAGRLATRLNLRNLLLKIESTNPTGSFKDRGISVAISAALEFGASLLVVASSGNTAASAAAYAARAGIPLWCLVPEGTPMVKVRQMSAHGAQVIIVQGTFSDAAVLAGSAAEALGAALLTSTYANPYLSEGYKTIAYEMVEARIAPDWILVPVGSGPLLRAIWRGFQDLAQRGLCPVPPRMVAVQAAACAPIVRAFEAGMEEVTAWDEPSNTMASAIADPLVGYPDHGTLTLQTVRESSGIAVAVDEAETAEDVRLLAAEGILAEPASATVVPAAARLVRAGVIDPEASVVTVITGHGLEDPPVFSPVMAITVPPNDEGLARLRALAPAP